MKKVSSIADNIGFNYDRSNAGSWSDVINAFKNKVGYNNIATSVNNISSGIFGFRTFKTDNNGDLVAVVEGDENSTFSGKVTTPHIYFTYMGAKYDLLASIGAFTSESLAFFKSLVSLFVTVGFALGLFRSIPDILMSAGRLVDSNSGEVITQPHMSIKR